MVRVAPRSYISQPRTGRYLLLSVILHLLALVALSLPFRPWESLRQRATDEAREPVLVSLVRPENTEEAEKAQVFAETSSRAQTPEGSKDDISRANRTVLPREQTPLPEPPPSPIAPEPVPARPQLPPPPL